MIIRPPRLILPRRKLMAAAMGSALIAGSAGAQTCGSPVCLNPAPYSLPTSLGQPIIPPSQLPRFRAALDATRLGTANTAICIAGDSTVFGYNGASSPPLWAKNINYWLGQYLNLGVPNVINGNFGFSNGEYFTSGVRWSLGSGWSANYGGLGGDMIAANSTTGATVFTPGVTCDRFVVWWLGLATGSFTATGTGSTATTITSAGDNLVHSTVVSCASALSSNTLSLSWVSGNAFVLGAFAYSSAAPCLEIYNSGWVSSKLSNWNDSGDSYGALTVIPQVKFPLMMFECGPNDWAAATSLSTFTTQLQAIITAQIGVGDMILFSPAPTNGTAQATQAQYVAVMKSLAAANNIPFIDLNTIYGTYTAGQTNGIYAPNNDGTHPGQAGYADEGRILASYLNTL